MSSRALDMAHTKFNLQGSPPQMTNLDFLKKMESEGYIGSKVTEDIQKDKRFIPHLEENYGGFTKGGSVKGSKKSSNEDRNKEAFDTHRCSARVWKPEGGKSYDKVQCHSKNIVTMDDVSNVLESFGMENPYRSVDEFKEGYGGCFCKKHLSMDFFMPKGYWLGKANEPRPENPMLPKGSVKKGYTEEYMPHHWLRGSDETKNEDNKSKEDGINEDVKGSHELDTDMGSYETRWNLTDT